MRSDARKGIKNKMKITIKKMMKSKIKMRSRITPSPALSLNLTLSLNLNPLHNPTLALNPLTLSPLVAYSS